MVTVGILSDFKMIHETSRGGAVILDTSAQIRLDFRANTIPNTDETDREYGKRKPAGIDNRVCAFVCIH